VRLTVVVMAYNEANTIAAVCSELLAAGADELLVIDDGSQDGTASIAQRMAASDSNVRVVSHTENLGLGMVYRSGFDNATGDLLTFFPADGQFPASIIGDFRTVIGDADLVLGYLEQPKRGIVGSLLSSTERMVHRILFGHVPRFQGVFMVRVAHLRVLPLAATGRGWTIVLEMIVRAQRAGWRIAHRPTPIRPRRSGKSKVNNWATIRSHVAQLVELRRVLSRAS